MTVFGDLLGHAERCERLAEICTDQQTAGRLYRLAREYRDLANCPTGKAESFVTEQVDIDRAIRGPRMSACYGRSPPGRTEPSA